MNRASLLAIGLVAWLAGIAAADVVTGRWGAGGLIGHPGTLKVEGGGAGTVLVFDLSSLPNGAKTYRARLVFTAGNGYEITCKEKPLSLMGPYFLWFDATEAVRASAPEGKAAFALQRGSGFKPDACYLEIACEGDLKDPPPQVTELKAVYRTGQVFLTFKEIEDVIAGGKEVITWGEIYKKKVSGCTPLGLIPIDGDRELRYHVYVHDAPITARSLGQATFLYELRPGSGYIEEQVAIGQIGEHGGSFLKEKDALARVPMELGKALPAGYGFHWHTAERPGKAYYAVVTCVNGVENTRDLSEKNTAGPLDVQVQTPEPMLYNDKVTKVRTDKGETEFHEQWYTWWVPPPLSPYPKRYDVVLSFCPEKLEKPCELVSTRGHAWIETPEPPSPGPYANLHLSPCSDKPNAFWMGVNNQHYTLRDWSQGVWRPWPQLRTDVLVRWVKTRFPVDEQRIVGSIGCWGMMEIERADLYSYLHGWGEPELTKGFQAWNRARGAWGPPEHYAGRPREENPWVRQDYSTWVLEHPERELPYFQMHMGWGAHFSEMGWPPFPRFYRAMMDTRRAFSSCAPAVENALRKGMLRILRDQSLPAFGNCSLDDNPGSGDPRCGTAYSAQINAYLLWDTATIADEPGRWEVTLWLDETAPLAECTVDVTPRRCQKFKARPQEKFRWTNMSTRDGKVIASGTVEADRWGLATLKQVVVGKARNRIRIER